MYFYLFLDIVSSILVSPEVTLFVAPSANWYAACICTRVVIDLYIGGKSYNGGSQVIMAYIGWATHVLQG
jgi:hypothetical protein